MPRKKTQEQIIKEFRQAHQDNYDYSLVKYVNSGTKVKIICPHHGVFEIAPGHHKNGVGCKKCHFESQKIMKEDFVRRSREFFGDLYDYSLFDEIPPAGEKASIRCTKHNLIFEQEPRNHLKGHTGCPECKALRLSGKRENRGAIRDRGELTKEFVERAQAIYQGFYDYSEFEYINAKTKGKIICPNHGAFMQDPANHLSGSKCPECSREEQKKSTLKQQCRDKGVDYYRALKRRQACLSEAKIFEQGYVRHSRIIDEIEVSGVKYPNFKEAKRKLISPASVTTIKRWLEEGMSPEEAFAKVPNPGYSKGFIYLVTNVKTQKQYVGLTIQPVERRWENHLEQAKWKTIKSDDSLHAAIREYGEDSFILETIDQGSTKKNLEQKERDWIKKLNTLVPNGYNICPGGVSGGSCKKPTVVDGQLFDSMKEAAEYVAETRDISISAAEKRIHTGSLDVNKPAKPGQSLVKTKAYKAHSRIIHQVLNPKSKDYNPRLDIYEPWRKFKTFHKDVGDPPAKNTAFTRLDKSKGFFPENCRWLTKSESSRLNGNAQRKKQNKH